MNSNRRRLSALLVIALAVGAVTGCADWERKCFQTLYTGKKVLDVSAAGYRNGYIEDANHARIAFPQTEAAYQAITRLGDAQKFGAQALLTYDAMKTSLNPNDPKLVQQMNVVIQAVDKIPPLIADVKALVKGVKF